MTVHDTPKRSATMPSLIARSLRRVCLHTAAKRTTAIGGSRASGIVQDSPPSSDIHKPPLVEPKASRSPLASTASAWRQTRS